MPMNRLATWGLATRLPFAFPASVIPALLGGLVALIHADVSLNVLAYVLVTLGAACVHGAANLMNDYFDFRKGVDSDRIEGSSRGMIVSGRMSPRAILTESLILWAISAAIAIYFLATIGLILLPLILLGFLLGAGYTAAPIALKYRALGDVSVFLAFGVGITVGSYLVQTGTYALEPVYYSIPIGLLIWAILHANNLRDIESDRAVEITTMAILLGPRRSRRLYLILISAAYVSLIGLASARLIVWAALLPLLTAPLAIKTIRQVYGARRSEADYTATGGVSGWEHGGLLNLDMRTAQLEMAFGLALLLGLLAVLIF